MKITNQQLYNAYHASEKLQNDSAGKFISDKLSYAVKRFREKNTKRVQKIEQDIRDLENEYCSVDERGNIILDSAGKLAFTKENLKELSEKKKELWEKEIELTGEDVFTCTDNSRVATLHPSWEIMNGLLFNYDFWAEVKE